MKYRNISVQAKAALWFTICNFLQKGISFIVVPIFTRIMSTEEYGTYTVYISWYQILNIISSLYLFNGVYDNALSLFDEDSMPRLYEKFILEYYRQHFPMLKPNDSSIRWDVPGNISLSQMAQLPGMHSDIMLKHGGKTLIIDAKYYKQSLAYNFGAHMIHSNNLYQIYAYVKNEDKDHTGNVSGMLLYARTNEDILPSLSLPIGGNQISARSLDLNKDFQEISYSLDRIVREVFGDSLIKIA